MHPFLPIELAFHTGRLVFSYIIDTSNTLVPAAQAETEITTLASRSLAMRLINVTTLKLEEFFEDSVPPYAILSHTWRALKEEVSFQEFRDHQAGIEGRPGYAKIRNTCRKAASQGLSHAWVDTCCIDKSSSAELSEAINSMFRWYQEAAACYVFLADLEDKKAFTDCRWFTRGWCLQELLAPGNIEFYDAQWNFHGTKSSLIFEIKAATGIKKKALRGRSLDRFTIAERMAWAATRETTRREDVAYSLLGIFEVHMPLLYGEGDEAFLRLQEHIMASSEDPSIFEWRRSDPQTGVSGLLASSPRDFTQQSNFRRDGFDAFRLEYSITNRGITLSNARIWAQVNEEVNVLELYSFGGNIFGIYVQKIGPQQYIRTRTDGLAMYYTGNLTGCEEMRVTIPKRLTPQTWTTISGSREYMISIRATALVGRLRCIFGERHWDSGREIFMRMWVYGFLGVLSFSLVIDDSIAEYVLVCYIGSESAGRGCLRAFLLPISEWSQFKHLIENRPLTPKTFHNWDGWEMFFSAFDTSSRALDSTSADVSYWLGDRVSCAITTGLLGERGFGKNRRIEITVSHG